MERISLLRLALRGAVMSLAFGLVGCSDPFALPPATVENRVDTVVVHGLAGAEIGQPSGYDIVQRSRAVVESGDRFDFVVQLAGANAVELFPTGALNLGRGPGFQIVDTPFDSLSLAPASGYNADSLTVAAQGQVVAARSRSSNSGCGFLGAVSRFAKLRVINVDVAANTVTFEIVANVNCGYRSLVLGLPTE